MVIKPDKSWTVKKRSTSVPLPEMLGIYLMQQWDLRRGPAMKEAVIEVPRMRRCAGIELIDNLVAGRITMLSVHQLLKKNGFDKLIVMTDEAKRIEKDSAMRLGTINDAILISASWSTMNKEEKRYTGIHQPSKVKKCGLRRKVYTKVDKEYGLVKSDMATEAEVQDLTPLAGLVQGNEEGGCTDK